MINKVILTGNLGSNPESITTKEGSSMAKFSLATNEKFNKDGELQTRTIWNRIVVFGKLADNVISYLNKGSKVALVGKIQTSTYEKDGETRYSTEIIANEVEFLSAKETQGSVSE